MMEKNDAGVYRNEENNLKYKQRMRWRSKNEGLQNSNCISLIMSMTARVSLNPVSRPWRFHVSIIGMPMK